MKGTNMSYVRYVRVPPVKAVTKTSSYMSGSDPAKWRYWIFLQLLILAVTRRWLVTTRVWITRLLTSVGIVAACLSQDPAHPRGYVFFGVLSSNAASGWCPRSRLLICTFLLPFPLSISLFDYFGPCTSVARRKRVHHPQGGFLSETDLLWTGNVKRRWPHFHHRNWWRSLDGDWHVPLDVFKSNSCIDPKHTQHLHLIPSTPLLSTARSAYFSVSGHPGEKR